MMTGYNWKPIEELPNDYESLASKELRSLAEIWKEHSQKLKDSDAIRKFNAELGRRWAIETGIIENLYSLDRGTTELLIEQGIRATLIQHDSTDRNPEYVAALLKDQESVLEAVFDFVKSERQLTTSYIKGLHALITSNQTHVEGQDSLGRRVKADLVRGEWKTLPNNPTRPDGEVHEYCPPLQVSAEMDRLIATHDLYVEYEVPPEVEAAWLHHRFTQIHPFQDGNGRIARALASLIFLRHGWFPLVIDRDVRAKYIDSLESADQGNLAPLVDLFVNIQKKAFVKALSISEDLLSRDQARRQLIDSARDKITARKQKRIRRFESVFGISSQLETVAIKDLEEVAREIDSLVKLDSPDSFASVDRSDSNNDYWFHHQIVRIAKTLDYFADTNTYKAWIRLKIKEQRQTEIVLSFHSLGTEFVGVAAVSAFVQQKETQEGGLISQDRAHVLCEEIFQFSYNENPNDVTARFEKWLDAAINVGIDEWRLQI